jgi:hypothetical protein
MSQNENREKSNEKNKKISSISRSKSNSRSKSPVKSPSNKIFRNRYPDPFDLLKKTSSNPFVDHKFIESYSYTRDIHKLEKLLKNLNEEIKVISIYKNIYSYPPLVQRRHNFKAK